MKPGCCSAISPCPHQQRSPDTICDICARAGQTSPSEVKQTPDGTERLCQALYGRKATARDYLGGSEAKMLHDAADRLAAGPPVGSGTKFGGPPNGYHPLPAGVACRCIKLWRDNKGNHWCCLPVEMQLDREEIALNAWAKATGAHIPWSRGYWPEDKEAARKGVRAIIDALTAPPVGSGLILADAAKENAP